MTLTWVPTHSLWHTWVALISNGRVRSSVSAFADMLSAYNALLYQFVLPLSAFCFTSANLAADTWKNGCISCRSCSSFPLSLAAISVEFVLNFSCMLPCWFPACFPARIDFRSSSGISTDFSANDVSIIRSPATGLCQSAYTNLI